MKINEIKEISKGYLVARLATLPNEQKIKIKLFNNFTSYSVNEELIDLQTVKTMQYSPPRLSFIPIADTPVCSITDDSMQDISPVPVVYTPACDNMTVVSRTYIPHLQLLSVHSKPLSH